MATLTVKTYSVTGSMFIASASQPANDPYFGASAHLLMVNISLSALFNTFSTVGIACRLFYYRKILRSTKASATLDPYVSISAILVESALLYTLNVIFAVVTLGLNNPLDDVLVPLLGQTETIAPLMIMYRVQRGIAWSANTYKSFDASASVPLSNIQFAPGTATIDSSTTHVGGRLDNVEEA